MVSKIQVRYGGITSLANTLSQHVDSMSETLQKLHGIVDTLRNDAWKGRGAQAFFVEIDIILANMQKLVEAVETSRLSFIQISDVFQGAESEAIKLFQQGAQGDGSDHKFGEGAFKFDQGALKFNEIGNKFDPAHKFGEVGEKFDQGAVKFNEVGNKFEKFDQGNFKFNEVGEKFDPGASKFNEIGEKFNPGAFKFGDGSV
jgi:WXG100 family type VII secretion target